MGEEFHHILGEQEKEIGNSLCGQALISECEFSYQESILSSVQNFK